MSNQTSDITKSQMTPFEGKEKFNELFSPLLENAYDEYDRIEKYFSKYTHQFGKDSFLPTIVVFDSSNNIVGIITSKSVEDKKQMYQAIAQMLYFPMSLRSRMFIAVQDARVRLYNPVTKTDEAEPQDALIVTYVSEETCTIFTVPYLVDSQNIVSYNYDRSWITQVVESNSQDSSVFGSMIEMFYIYTHSETVGPFTPAELLSFYKDKGFSCHIINPSTINQVPLAIPIGAI